MIGYPTSSDIYIEAEGKKIAVVQSYQVTATKSERHIEAFGEEEPIATIASNVNYKIVLTRLYATDAAISDGISFHDLRNFSLVIVKPDRRVVFTGCQWSNIEEDGQLREMVAEKVTLIASHRIETR